MVSLINDKLVFRHLAQCCPQGASIATTKEFFGHLRKAEVAIVAGPTLGIEPFVGRRVMQSEPATARGTIVYRPIVTDIKLDFTEFGDGRSPASPAGRT